MNSLLRFCGLALWALPAVADDNPQSADYFESRVRPVLSEKCFGCHGANKQHAGLRLDSRSAMLKGTEVGKAVLVPGEADRSPLVQAILHTGAVKMPPTGKLSEREITALIAWLKAGAVWPATTTTSPLTTSQRHWAFAPVVQPALPAVKLSAWPQTPVDRFILAKLEAGRHLPAEAADRRTLIRRATFDLHGLPPTFEEAEGFIADDRPDAWKRLIDRLLASPRYGERWGRHWLDVARYADTKGYAFQEERRYPFAYTYRDWVIAALNDDQPYDRFLIHQIAADRLGLVGPEQRHLAALGFLTLGRRFLNNIHDIIDDRIDVVMRGTMGLTVQCARCHDHKYDPIPQADYYSLYGIFASSIEPKELPTLGLESDSPAYPAFAAELSKRREAVAKFEAEQRAALAMGDRGVRNQLRALQRLVDEWVVAHAELEARAMALVDAPAPTNPYVFLRGNPGNRGPSVPRQFLRLVAGDTRQPFHQGSGRLELAEAIASADNPLTARVAVNRVWMHHFGTPLV